MANTVSAMNPRSPRPSCGCALKKRRRVASAGAANFSNSSSAAQPRARTPGATGLPGIERDVGRELFPGDLAVAVQETNTHRHVLSLGGESDFHALLARFAQLAHR